MQERQERGWLRWIILGLISLILFGSYYVYDVFSPINEFIQNSMGIDNSRYGLLATFYSLPNLLFLVVVAGVILDRIGIRKAGIVFGLLCVVGSLITTLAAGRSFLWMLIGRMVFGFGSEAAILVVNKVIARWFRGRELGFAFGLNILICRLGTVAALNSSAQIMNYFGSWRWSVWAGTIVMFLSFLSFLVYLGVEKKTATGSSEVQEEEEKFNIREVLEFGPAFWFISILCVTFYSAMFPFLVHAPRLLQLEFDMSAARGGFYTSLATWATIFCTPLFGLLVDKKGWRGMVMILGSLLLFPAHLMLGLTGIHPSVPFILMGISFSLVPAALWPAVPILIRERYLGTAYGLIGWIQNIGLALFPWIGGKLVDAAGGNDYTYMQIMFASLGFVGLLFSLLLKAVDKRRQLGLELPSSEAHT
ncbi:MAG: MFS transporter [Candidatus Latescibacteria bacterium]|nr:MFS transporter [bacterium]MBD3424385.1 MFS transporter [Candidatus Latescibacterota bacterium]